MRIVLAVVVLAACSSSLRKIGTGPTPPAGPRRIPQVIPVTSGFTAAALTSDGRLAIVGDRAGTVRVIDLVQHRVVRVIERHRDAIDSIAVRTGDRLAVIAGSDGVVCALDLGKLDLAWCKDAGGGLQFGKSILSPDGHRYTSRRERWIRGDVTDIYEVASGRRLATLDVYLTSAPIWSADGKQLAYTDYVGGRWPLIVRDASAGTRLATIELGDSPGAIAFTSDGLIAVARRGAVDVYKPTGDKVKTIDHAGIDHDEIATLAAELDRDEPGKYPRLVGKAAQDDPDRIDANEISALPNGELLLRRTVHVRGNEFRGYLTRVSTATGKVTQLSRRSGEVMAVATGGGWVVNGFWESDGIVKFVAIPLAGQQQPDPRFAVFPQVDLTTGVVTRHGEVMIGASWGIMRFDLATGAVSAVATEAPVIAIGDSGRFVITRKGDDVKLWGLTQGRLEFVRALDRPYFPGGKKSNHSQQLVLDLACDDTDACRVLSRDRVADAATGADPHVIPAITNDLKSEIDSVALSADGRRVIHANSTLAHVSNVTNGQNFGAFWEVTDVDAVAITRDGKHVAVGTTRDSKVYLENRVVIIETATGRRVREFEVPDVGIARLEFSWDGKQVLLAGKDVSTFTIRDRAVLRVLDIASGKQRDLVGETSEALAIGFAPDGRHALSVHANATARVWDLTTGKSMMMTGTRSAWLVYDDDGNFDASRNGGSLIAAVENGRAYALDQLALRNNRPDRLFERIGIGTPEVIDYFRRRHASRLAKLNLTDGQLASVFAAAPTVVIDRANVVGNDLEISATLASTAAPLLSYQIWINGVPVLPGRGERVTGAKQQITKSIVASGGTNKIEITALSQAGVESQRAVREVTGRERIKGDLYYVVIGVSSHRDPRLDLRYASKDARDLAAIFDGASADYGAIHPTILLDDQVTASTIRAAKQALAAATPHDTVIVFAAGHGTHGEGKDPEYLFVTHDFDPSRKDQTAAPLSLIEGLFADIAARKKLLLLDTCESGERDDSASEASPRLARVTSRTARALMRVKIGGAAKKRVPRKYLLDRDRLIFSDLGRGNGTIMLSSSRWDEDSYESEDWSNGAFTFELKAALTSDVADTNGDGAVSIEELVRHIAHGVAKRTNQLQHPVLGQDNEDSAIEFAVRTRTR